MSSDVGSTESPSSVVDRVLEALNGRDIDAFVASYARNATIEDRA